MTRIGLLSDTHGYLDESIILHLTGCDEIWHAGDWGHAGIAELIENKTGRPVRGVYGNIDGPDIRKKFPEKLHFTCEKVNVFITHIGGYPKKYAAGIKEEIRKHHAGLFICGHSHILKVIHDPELDCLHMNPGAAGKQGWHTVRTLIRFSIDGGDIRDAEVVELP